MEAGDSKRSLLLNPKGKVDHILWVIGAPGRIGLVTEPGRGKELAAALGRYRIRVDVTVAPETAQVWLVIAGGDGYDVSWAGAPRRLVIGERPDLAEESHERYEALRIAAGEPMWGVDVDETAIPQETGLVEASVDFDKGCFLGQELVARINSRGGAAPRRLRLLDLDAPAEVGAPIEREGKRVGALTSVSGAVGMSLIHRDVGDGDAVAVGGATAAVRAVPPKPQTHLTDSLQM